MARKKKTEEKLTQLISFRLTAADHQRFFARLKELGLKPSEFFRLCLLQNQPSRYAPRRPHRDNRRLVDLFEYISFKVNQLAHRVNSEHLARTISETTYREVGSELHSLCQIIKTVLDDVDQDLRRN